ncbi:MAG: hypothetical protein V1676_03525 [Candidatus Diapherotrites archaeon]
MGNWYAFDSIGEGIAKARGLLRGPGLFGKWMKLAVLVFIVSLLSGGWGGLDYRASDSDATQFAGVLNQAAAVPSEIIIIAIIAAIAAALIVGAIFGLVRNVFFFATLESITTGQAKIFGYLGKFAGLAVSLTLFEIVLALITLPFGIAFALSIAGMLLMFGLLPAALTSAIYAVPVLGGIATFASNPLAIVAMGIIGALGIAILAAVNYIKGQFAEYMMYMHGHRAFDAFKRSAGLVRRNLAQVIILLFAQFLLLIAIGIISVICAAIFFGPPVIAGLLIGGALGITGMLSNPIVAVLAALVAGAVFLIAAFLMNLVLTPVKIFTYFFNLAVLEKMSGGGAVITVAKGAKGWPKGDPR